MTLKKLTALAAVTLAGFAASPAFAQTITNNNGALVPFGGFNWSAAGAGWTDGFTAAVLGAGGGVTGRDFTIYFASHAEQILQVNQNGFPIASVFALDNVADGVRGSVAAIPQYEYTVFFAVSATLVAATPTSADYIVNGASFNIYYDTALLGGAPAQSSIPVRSGYQDGALLLSGTMVDDQAPGTVRTFNDSGTNGIGLIGTVSYTNSTYITPNMAGSRISSTVQFGAAAAGTGNGFVIPTSVDGDSTDCIGALSPEVCFQAQANQTFDAAVPEPATLLMVGLALAGVGASSSRRRTKQ